MSKIIVTLIAALALSHAGCTSTTTTATATGCVAMRPDAGTNGSQCIIEWSCASGAQHYEIDCTLVGSNYSCNCGTDTSTLTKTILINPFSCDLSGGALPAAAQCGYTLQM